MPKQIILPPNLCAQKKDEGKSIYYRDYCSRYRNRTGYKPKSSYKSMITENSVNNLIMTDHYNSMLGYSQKGYDDTLNRINNDLKTIQFDTKILNESEGPIKDENIGEKLPASLRKIEEAWAKEIDTSKRERGLIYGDAGKKNAKKNVDTLTRKSLPGLDIWLNTANEYEKQVVHNFITKVSDSYQTEEEPRKEVTPRSKSAGAVHVSRSAPKLRFQTPPKSASVLLTRRSRLEGGLSSPTNTQKDEDDRNSVVSSSTCRTPPPVPKDAYTQHPHEKGGKASSPVYDKVSVKEVTHKRSLSSPSTFKHTCRNCEACERKLKKKILQDLTRSNPSTYMELLNEKPRFATPKSTQIYRPLVFDDYAHQCSTFQRVNRFQKGYFIIHPDFVSESLSRYAITS